MIAKLELRFAYERSNIKAYKEARFTRVQCKETIDNKACAKCKERHGSIYSIDKRPGLAHPRCRVTRFPVD
ncbi:hypothetical protein Curi_c14700 [Gottschalkia acidurici 9a]|uniref:Phage head morphogenesis domain-containing protein n=1 Tax=Gottschalkia acidurici (strain ATCC 7906 / DSM 604 / BCRC 14475 / CIP 104303 / KCTC 5404 / NCIMB 10678 / 9a) TaxID=1128398 RepID=K0B0P5_GOTA9|nr:hypothetical protein [Gottschalkia acidurici]AFS78480.1 hypothetical protein Curi_c14700 [Gottschalkia acidurici 9a]